MSPPHDSELYTSADRIMLTVFERQARLDPNIWNGIEATPVIVSSRLGSYPTTLSRDPETEDCEWSLHSTETSG
jgi:hypothetical protein